jgi:hypothetical protein
MEMPETDRERCEADPTYVPAHDEDSLQAYMGCWGPCVLLDVSRWLAFNTADGSAELAQLDGDKVPDLISFIYDLGLDFGTGGVEESDLKTIERIVSKRLPANYQTMRQRLKAGISARAAEMKEMGYAPQLSSDEEEGEEEEEEAAADEEEGGGEGDAAEAAATAGCTVSALPKRERVDNAAGSSSGDANIGGGRRHATSTGMKRRAELAGEGEDPQPQP